MDPYNSADAFAGARAPSNPYAAPASRVAEVRSQELNKASRLTRLGAVMLDGLLVAVPAIIAAVALPGMQSGKTGLSGGAMAMLAVVVLWVVGFSIYQLVQLHRTGQTFGKKIVGVRIVRSDGSRAGLGRIFLLRYFAPGLIGAIPFIGSFFSLADSLLIFGSEKRCIHDYFADTIVVDA